MTGIIVAIYGSPKGMNVSNKAISISTIGLILITILVIGITIYCMSSDDGKSKQSHWLTFSVYWIFTVLPAYIVHSGMHGKEVMFGLFVKICTMCSLVFSIITIVNCIVDLCVRNMIIKMIYMIASITKIHFG